MQVVGDDAHGGGDDRLIECGQKHPHHQPGQGGQDLVVSQCPLGAGAVATAIIWTPRKCWLSTAREAAPSASGEG